MSAHGLCVYRSNRLERLAEALAEQLSEAPEDPFAPECILVPGRGVAQWLSLEMSQRFGVWANVLYLYPRNFVGWALERVLDSPAAGLEAFDPERLLWSIVSTLRPLLARPEFEAIQRYVSADPSDVRYFELCRRIASTFDRYAAYRPDLLSSWERKARPSAELPQLGLFGAREPQAEVQGWQALLWKALVERSGSVPMGTLERRFLRRVQRSQRLENLPARISCFGVTHVPPSYARILVALCPHVPVRMFQLAASRRVEPARHNPLLESLGALASDFEALLSDELKQQGVPVSSVALFEAPAAPTRLARLQRELLEDVAPGPSPARGVAGDESIRIHVCHSPMREVEVLHDQLLALLSSDSGYEARDVVVMMPDIETYAPLIDAVFRRSGEDPQRIPYSLADRVLEAAAPVASALDRLFLLAGQRLSTSQVLDLLALEVVAARFELTPRDLEQISEWLQRTNVRWGIDADHREAHGHPRSDANTWRLGVRRLLLGYAMNLEPPALVSGILPEPGPSGSGAAALGKLASFLESLFQHLHALAQPHRASEWPEVVSAALDALVLHDSDTAWQHQELLEALRALTRRALDAGYDEPIGSAALHGLLFEAVNGARPARGFLMGGVTFCSLVPLRSIPFRVVCLVGLGDGDFPRQDASTDFDLIVHGPGGRRRGDRSRRMEDRYIFLEAILAARERLIITYTGQSIRDNSSLPPSVVVAELCDTIAAWREPAPAAPETEQGSPESSASAEGAPDYIVSHPLQAFSPRYFDASDPRLFSYAAHYAAANRARYRSPLGQFFVGPLPTPAPDALALAELVRFYRGPAGYLLNRRLELYLRESGEALADREPLELSGLESYAVGQALLELGRRGVTAEQARELVMAGGALPLGTPGELDFQEIASCASKIAALAAEARAGGRQPPLPFEARLPSGRVLFGSLNESYAHGLVEQQFARIRASHLLSLWIRHLVYCWVAPAGAEAHSSLFGRPLQGGGAVHQRFRPVKDPALRLDALVRRFDQGQTLPLSLFPTTSLAYAQAALALARNPGGKRDAYAGLDKEWQLELQRDSHLQRVYGADRSFAELRREHQAEFEQLALEIFEPLIEHLESEEHGEE
ncbi:MAG TPA: exodeoxyribonuclease V subunit gamma [Polyangiaceae bacterium]|nr:exodeoxyribonuclease V subunit gamma [Polyangiaceae bacterium]